MKTKDSSADDNDDSRPPAPPIAKDKPSTRPVVQMIVRACQMFFKSEFACMTFKRRGLCQRGINGTMVPPLQTCVPAGAHTMVPADEYDDGTPQQLLINATHRV